MRIISQVEHVVIAVLVCIVVRIVWKQHHRRLRKLWEKVKAGRPRHLSAAKQQLISRANHLHPEIRMASQLALDFAAMLRTHDAARLDRWVQEAVNSNIPSLAGFAAGLGSDYEAIRAALRLPWSNGQVEGQVNRLKFIKRQMYGRAKFDLLRLRVLYH